MLIYHIRQYISAHFKEANIIDEHRQVKGSHQISIRAADFLEDMRPQHYNGANRDETVRTINDILQGRTERTVDAFLTGLRDAGGDDYAPRVEEISREIISKATTAVKLPAWTRKP